MEKLGPQGKFPRGKIRQDDKGELKFAIRYKENGVVLDFGEKPIRWFAMPSNTAEELGHLLADHVVRQYIRSNCKKGEGA